MINKKTLMLTVSALFIVLGTLAGIFYLRGFRLDTQNGGIARTGLLVIDTTPDGAKIFLDGRLTGATDTTIAFLTPKKYQLKLEKEGYYTWEKEIEVRADLTTEVDAVLFPAIPDLRPLTFTGAVNPQISPDATKIVYGVPEGEKAGLWVLSMADRPLGIGGALTQIVKNTSELNFAAANLSWSPDSSQVLAQVLLGESQDEAARRNYLLDAGRLNTNLVDATATLPATFASWQQEINLKETARIQRLKKDLPEVFSQASNSLNEVLRQATTSASFSPTLTPSNLFWSPDETKFFIPKSNISENLYQNGVTVYRIRDPNPLKPTPATFEIPSAEFIYWFADSDHLILAGEGKISVIEYEGTNNATIFTGAFENSFVFPWPNGSKLVILTNFNQEAGTLPNLYTINLR